MTLGTLLRLGRVSNLPTVWTNALAGAVLGSGGVPDIGAVLMTCLALSFFYEGGMWLNDAFDAEIDAKERVKRPIPSGEIDRLSVFLGGWAMIACGVLVAFAVGGVVSLVALALAVAVVLYDWLHKRTHLSPLLMGAARFLSYVLGGSVAGSMNGMLLVAAAGLFAYVVGLTYAAKQEAHDRIGNAWPLAVLGVPLAVAIHAGLGHFAGLVAATLLALVIAFALHRLFRRAKGDVPVAVVTMIAGISLYDAAIISSAGPPELSFFAIAGFAITLLLQKVASGT